MLPAAINKIPTNRRAIIKGPRKMIFRSTINWTKSFKNSTTSK